MKFLNSCLSLLAVLLIINAVFLNDARAGGKVFVAQSKTNKGGDSLGDSIHSLIQAAVSEADHELVLNPKEAEVILRPTVLRLGAAVVITLKKFVGKKLIYTGKLKTQKLENLDVLATRLTRAVLDTTLPEKDLRLGEITDEDMMELPRIRRRSPKGMFISMGASRASKLDSGLRFTFGIGGIFVIDRVGLRVYLDIATGSGGFGHFSSDGPKTGGSIFNQLGTGVVYYVLKKPDVTPVLSADMGIAYVRNERNKVPRQSKWGFTGSFGLGIAVLLDKSHRRKKRAKTFFEFWFRSSILNKRFAAGIPVNNSLLWVISIQGM